MRKFLAILGIVLLAGCQAPVGTDSEISSDAGIENNEDLNRLPPPPPPEFEEEIVVPSEEAAVEETLVEETATEEAVVETIVTEPIAE